MRSASRWASLNEYTRDYYGGGLMLLLGLGVIDRSVSYEIGTLTAMGPGYFPLAVGVILVLCGALIAAGARRKVVDAAAVEAKKPLPPEWKAWFCIGLSIVAFVVLGRFGGLIPATFATVFISALGDRQNNVKRALVLAVAMVVVAVLVFWWGLQVQLPLWQWG